MGYVNLATHVREAHNTEYFLSKYLHVITNIETLRRGKWKVLDASDRRVFPWKQKHTKTSDWPVNRKKNRGMDKKTTLELASHSIILKGKHKFKDLFNI